MPFYVIGNELGKPVGTSTLYVSIFSSLSLQRATLDGRDLALLAEQELGRKVYSSYVDIPPGGTRTLTLTLSGSVDLSGGNYHFDYLAQVLPNPDRVDWTAQVAGGRVVGATGRGASPVDIRRAATSALVSQSGERGPWSIDLALQR